MKLRYNSPMCVSVSIYGIQMLCGSKDPVNVNFDVNIHQNYTPITD